MSYFDLIYNLEYNYIVKNHQHTTQTLDRKLKKLPGLEKELGSPGLSLGVAIIK